MKIKTKSLKNQKTCFLLVSCFLCIATYSQTKDSALKKIYLQLASGGSSKNGSFSELGIQAVLKNNWTATFSYHNIKGDPKNLPSNYEPGYTVLIILPIGGGYPTTNMNLFSFTGGKCFEAGRKIWFTAEAGFSVIDGEKMTFNPQPVELDGWYYSSNYSIKKENKTAIGGILKADFNWAFLPFAGLGAGAFANFNSIQSPVGFQVKLIVGWMNRKRKN